jgi:hypothetical protein
VEVTFCQLRVDTVELRRRLERRYEPDDVARALTEAEAWDRHGASHPVIDTGEGDPGRAARRVVEAVRAAAPAAPAAPSAPSVAEHASSAPRPVTPGAGRPC